jgi:nitrite reductase (NO-forming)
LLSSIERDNGSLDLATCTYGVVTCAPSGEIGEPIRIFVVNAGTNTWSSFDAANSDCWPTNTTVGQRSVTEGACVELTLTEPGTYPSVNHTFSHAEHTAIAPLQAS